LAACGNATFATAPVSAATGIASSATPIRLATGKINRGLVFGHSVDDTAGHTARRDPESEAAGHVCRERIRATPHEPLLVRTRVFETLPGLVVDIFAESERLGRGVLDEADEVLAALDEFGPVI